MMHHSNTPPPSAGGGPQQQQQQQQQHYNHYHGNSMKVYGGGVPESSNNSSTNNVNNSVCAGCKRGGLNLLVCDDCASPDSTGNKVKQRFCAQCMIGKKVRVFWPLDQKWYVGVVHEFNSNTGEHLLVYPDGDDEWVRIGDNQGIATEGGGGGGGGNNSAVNSSPVVPHDTDEGGVGVNDGVAAVTPGHGTRGVGVNNLSPPSPVPRQQHPGMDDMFFNHGGGGGYGGQAGYDSAKKREREPSSSGIGIPAYDRSYTMAKLRAAQQEHLSAAMSTNLNQGGVEQSVAGGGVAPEFKPQQRPASPMDRRMNDVMLQPPLSSHRGSGGEGHHSPTTSGYSSGGGSEWPPPGLSSQTSLPQPGPPSSPQGPGGPNSGPSMNHSSIKSHRGPPSQEEPGPHLSHPGFGMHHHGPPPPHMHYQHHGMHPGYPPPGAQSHPYPSFGGGRPPYNMYPPPPSSTMDDKEDDASLAAGCPSSTGKRKSGPKTWTKEEDTILLNMVQNMRMPMKWSIVAQSMPDRTGKQCRERYVNHLNPRLKNAEWSPQEDATIFHLYNSVGSQWAKMSKMIPGRTDNGIKNRFHNLRRQLEREDDHRLRLSKPQDFPEEINLDRLRESFPQDLQGKNHMLWDMTKGIGIVAAQSVIGAGVARNQGKFGPFKIPDDGVGDACVRCGLFVPSIQCGDEICERTKWCVTCTRIPPHLSGNLLRECLNLRKSQDPTTAKVIDCWHKCWKGMLPADEEEHTLTDRQHLSPTNTADLPLPGTVSPPIPPNNLHANNPSNISDLPPLPPQISMADNSNTNKPQPITTLSDNNESTTTNKKNVIPNPSLEDTYDQNNVDMDQLPHTTEQPQSYVDPNISITNKEQSTDTTVPNQPKEEQVKAPALPSYVDPSTALTNKEQSTGITAPNQPKEEQQSTDAVGPDKPMQEQDEAPSLPIENANPNETTNIPLNEDTDTTANPLPEPNTTILQSATTYSHTTTTT